MWASSEARPSQDFNRPNRFEVYVDNPSNYLPPAPSTMAPAKIKHLRETNHTSQAHFAELLTMSRSAVSAWEAGRSKPGPIALKLLSIVEKHGLRILA